jgi:hypothetical protein
MCNNFMVHYKYIHFHNIKVLCIMVDLLWNNVIEKKSFAVWIVFDVESVTVGRAMDNTLSLLFFYDSFNIDFERETFIKERKE